MQWILCSMIECSGFHAASLNAEDSMHSGAMDPDCFQWSRCSEAQSIPIECSGFHALLLNAVYYMQHGEMHPVECRGFNAARLNAVDSMQREEMEPY